MQRTSGDYAATTTGRCEKCGRTVFPGMTIYNVKLKNGRQAIAHSLCEHIQKTKMEVNNK